MQLQDRPAVVQHQAAGAVLVDQAKPVETAPTPLAAEPRTVVSADLDTIEADMQRAIAARPKKKRPAAAPLAQGPPLKRPASTSVTAARNARPPVPPDGTDADILGYLGGRIYDDFKSQRLRCYRQSADRVEKTISYKHRSRADCYRQAFQAIEEDPRVASAE